MSADYFNRTLLVSARGLMAGFAVALSTIMPAFAAAPMMQLPGNVAVNDLGQATYTIPIDVPPGTAGMAPSLSLSYSSGNGNGIVGVGWTLLGLPMISRCAPTIAQDGISTSATVTFTSSDDFCYRGQKLVSVSGTYGAPGSIYRTELESETYFAYHSKNATTLSGSSTTGPWWEVRTKSGQIMEFGATSDSSLAQSNGTAVESWSVDYIADRNGNYQSIKYTPGSSPSSGEIRPNEIDYTLNSTTGATAYNKVVFDYVSQSPALKTYISGATNTVTALLSEIRTYDTDDTGNQSLTNSYILGYTTSNTNRSELISVTKCDGASSPDCAAPSWTAKGGFSVPGCVASAHCLPPTEFTYSSAGSLSTTAVQTSIGSSTSVLAKGLAGNFSGSGKSDLLTWKVGQTGKSNYPTGILSASVWVPTASGTLTEVALGTNTTAPSPSCAWVPYVGDFDGDGKDDIYWDCGDGTGHLWLSNGDGTFAGVNLAGNSFGRTITIGLAQNIFSQYHNVTSSYGVIVGDLNGDGRADIMIYAPHLLWNDTYTKCTNSSKTNGSSYITLTSGQDANGGWKYNGTISCWPISLSDTLNDYAEVTALDFNGDGKIDLLVVDKMPSNPSNLALTGIPSGTKWLLSGNGDGTFAQATFNAPDSVASTCHSYTTAAGDTICWYTYWIPAPGFYGTDNNAGLLWEEYSVHSGEEGVWPTGAAKLWIGKGDGNFDSVPISFPGNDNNCTSNTSTDWVPHNGDFRGTGRTDILWLNQSGSNSGTCANLAISNGDGTFSSTGNFTLVNGSVYISGDFNGDGKDDILAFGQTLPISINYSDPTPTDLLLTVTTGLGHVKTVSYGNLTNSNIYTPSSGAQYPIVDFSSGTNVVTSVTDDQGLGNGATVSSNYQYAGAKYDVSGRGFLSFSERTITDIQGNVTTNYYDINWPLTGLLAHSSTLAAYGPSGQEVSQTTNSYQWSSLSGQVASGAASGYTTTTLQKSTKNTWDLDGNAGATTTTSYSYDSYNNPVTVSSTVTDPSAAPWNSGVTTSSTTNIYTNDPSSWIMGRLVCSQVTNSVTGGSYHTRTILNTYNGYGLLTATVLEPNSADETAVAALTTLDTASGGGNSANVSTTCQTTASGDTYRRLETDYAHNSYGNLTSVTERPSDTLPDGTADPVRQTIYSSYDANNRLPTSVINALGQETDYTYDWRFGLPHIVTSKDDPALSSTTTYDGFGRLSEVKAADKTYVTYIPNYISCTATSTVTCPANGAFQWTALTYGTNHAQFAPGQQTTYDTLGRVVAQDSPTFDAQDFSSNRNRVTTRYNSLFQVKEVTQPYFANASSTASTSYTYDVLNRVSTVSMPGCGIPAKYGYSNGGLYVTETNCESEVTYAWTSGSGVTIQTADALGYTTTMQPGPFGKTLSVADPAGNSTIYAYDNVGNVTNLSDPDSDNWVSTFDSFGKLLTRTHDKVQTTNYSYDKLGRLTQRQDSGSGDTDNWSYDPAISKTTSCDGQLASESTSGGYSVTYSYDGLCRETNRLYGGTSAPFVTTYDPTTGRVSSITYPSGVVVSPGYSAAYYPSETLVATPGGGAQLFSQVNTANAALQPVMGTTGDGVQTSWNWDGNNRLSDITAGPSGSSSVQNLNYLYDGIGNVIHRGDAVAGLAEDFTYDAKNQLTASYLNGDKTGKAFAYDALGNLTYRSDIGLFSYGYGGKPHALASIQVDPNSPYAATAGTLEGNNYSWTWFNAVSEITQIGVNLQYSYDNQHRRFTQISTTPAKSSGEVTTYLRGPGGTEEDQTTYRTPNRTTVNDLIPGIDGIAGEVVSDGNGNVSSILYYHKDQLGSVTAVSGSSSEIDSYDVWGKRRLTNGGDDTNCSVTSIASRGYIAEEHIDADCPVINLNARLYDPLTTRFLSPDPMGLAAGPNPYAYANNNPITNSDPTGLDDGLDDRIAQDPQATIYSSAGTYWGGYGWTSGPGAFLARNFGVNFSPGQTQEIQLAFAGAQDSPENAKTIVEDVFKTGSFPSNLLSSGNDGAVGAGAASSATGTPPTMGGIAGPNGQTIIDSHAPDWCNPCSIGYDDQGHPFYESGQNTAPQQVLVQAQAIPYSPVNDAMGRVAQGVFDVQLGVTQTLAGAGWGEVAALAPAALRLPVIGSKLSYFLGEASGNAHNIARSTSMASQLGNVGLWNNAQTRNYLAQHLAGVLNNDGSIAVVQANGRIVRNSLLSGPGGFLKWETIWDGNKLITGTFFGGE